jgi:lipopolysaccharide heptosyltransferase I
VRTPSLRRREFRRILLIKPSALGDVIHAVPVLAKLRARYPAARIDWLLTPAIAEWIGHHPGLSNVVLFPRQELARLTSSLPAALRLARALADLRRTRYDLVIDLHGQFRSAVFTLATGASVRIGFDRPRRRLRHVGRRLVPQAYRHGWTGARELSWLAYSHRVAVPTLDVHAVDRYLWVGPLLGLGDGAPDFRVPVPAASQARVDSLLAGAGLAGRPLTVHVPGTLWETKHWHAEGFAAVARHLLSRGRAVVLAGSQAERPRCRSVAALAPGAVDFSGRTTVSELAALVRRAEVCVTNDSGSMHLAVAMSRPVVSIFGPTDPVWIGPYGRPGAVAQAGVACAPCYLRRLDRCPHGHACMAGVTAEMVIERLERVLAGLRAAG